MPTLSDYVEHAFNAIRVINTEEWLQEDIEAFQERWGGVDLVTFARVLQQAQGDDQMVTTFAIGHTRSAWARGLLLPFLQSDDPGVRWAAALSLGEMKDERARPVLVRMLGEFLEFHDGVSLYDIREALPRRGETERQREARLAAWPRIQEKYKCEHCGYVPESLADIKYEMSGPGLSLGCKERLEWLNEQAALDAQIAEDRRDVCAWAYSLLRRSDWALIDTDSM